MEDEYDAEYRYEGRPIAALQSLDRTGSVIYVGTFTKVLFNALRIGFLVLPESLVKPFVTARSFIDRHPPFMNQAILAEFISEGYFSQHVKKMRVAYAERLGVLCSEADKHLSELVKIQTPESGMRVVASLCNGMSDKRAAQLAQAGGIETLPISMFSSEYRHPPGLMLGFAGCNPADIRLGVKTPCEGSSVRIIELLDVRLRNVNTQQRRWTLEASPLASAHAPFSLLSPAAL